MTRGLTYAGSPRRVHLPKDLGPRKVDETHIAYALARRPRTSWQAIAQQLGVNASALERAVTAAQAPPPPAPSKPEKPQLTGGVLVKPGTGLAMTLLALADGVSTRKALAKRLGLSFDGCGDLVRMLINKKLLGAGWTLTPLGEEHAAWLRGQG